MGNIILLTINGDTFAFKGPSMTKEVRIALQSLASTAYADNEELYDKSVYEIVDWFIAEARKDGVNLETVGIDLELTISE